ncbi:unnamed protein product [Meganyctiphanes norvegica]|uniref:Uncharacterized protein n=1 Tax=Meganyctiphanes norvegica TaxID=48144 RepID=A0AAV2PPE9_MEGNR
MLKFRVTNSVKARRAAEAQRKALEEKLQLEWAWKPLAAMMNENKTDLVYWIPPLYSSNVSTATNNSAATASRHGSVRKKKLSSSRRRAKLTSGDSITEEMEEDRSTVKEDYSSTYCPDDRENNSSIVGESLPDDDEWENQDDNESDLHENGSVVSSDKDMSDIDKEILMHNSLIQNTPVIVRSNTVKPKKLTSSPTLLKLMEKVSNLHGLSGIMQMKNKDKEVRQDANDPKKSSNKKNKRPSVRVYQRHIQRSSARSNSSSKSNNKTSNQEEIIITTEPLLSAKPSIKRVNSNQPKCEETESGIFDTSDTDNEDATSKMEDQRNAQLQMMLHILAQLYEDKLTRQETELEHLRTRVQTQEKLMKQLVHVTMDLKTDLDKVKKDQKIAKEFKAVAEKLKKIEQTDDSQSSNSHSNKKVNIGPKPPISPKPNILTVKLEEN